MSRLQILEIKQEVEFLKIWIDRNQREKFWKLKRLDRVNQYLTFAGKEPARRYRFEKAKLEKQIYKLDDEIEADQEKFVQLSKGLERLSRV